MSKFFSINFSTGFKRYFANTSWLFSERILSMIITLFVGIYVARYLGPQRYGLLNYAVSFVVLFSVISSFGLDQIIVRELIKYPTKKECFIGTLFILKLIGAFIVLGLISCTLYFTDNDTKTKCLILIISAGLIFQSFHAIDIYFQSQVVAKYTVYSQLIQVVFSSFLKIFFVFINADLMWFAVVILVDNIILAISLLYFFRSFEKEFFSPWKFNIKIAKDLLKESWPLALSALFVTVYMKIDQVMIKEMLNAESVGIYAVAARLSEIWYFIPGIIVKSLFPAIINMKYNFESVYLVRLQQLHDFLSLIAFVIALLISLFANDIVAILFGEQYMGAGRILAIHIWASLLVFPGNVRAHLIILEKKEVAALIFRSMGALLNILLNYYLIPKIGPAGAAWATLASFFFPVIIISFFDPHIRLTVMMTFKSYCLPFRAIIFRRSLYSV